MPRSVHIAIIGCGSIAEQHVDCLKRLGGVSIVAFCDREETRAWALRDRWGGGMTTTNPHSVFENDAVEAVYVCTTTDTHAPLALAAIDARKHIFMEKPLALTEGECNAVADAADRSALLFMMGFKFRYYPAIARARSYIPRPLLSIGQITDVRWPDDFWGNNPRKGGGNVLSQGCHAVDLVSYLHKSEPERVYAEGGNFAHPCLEIVDTAVLTLRFSDGSVSSLTLSDAGPSPFVSKFSLQLFDGNRGAHVHNRMMSVTVSDGETSARTDDDEERGLLEENREFLACVRERRTPSVTHRDGVRATVVLLRALAALRSGVPQICR